MDIIKELTADMLKADAPKIEIGSTVKVHVRIKEGEKERIQAHAAYGACLSESGHGNLSKHDDPGKYGDCRQ